MKKRSVEMPAFAGNGKFGVRKMPRLRPVHFSDLNFSVFVIFFALVMMGPLSARAQTKTQTVEANDHSYVSLREVEMEIRDFSFPTLAGRTLRLSEAVKGKKLVLVHYFAAWCHNSNFDVKTMTDLYLRYFDQGLLVIGVCEYSKNDELREFIERHRPTYPICIEGDGKKKNRTGTMHYFYRNQVDDQRTWGTPLNILISAEDLLNEGEIVAKKVRVAPGEVIPKEFEDLIREKLSKK